MFGLPQQLPTVWLSLAVILLLAKHLVADFFVQTHWMAEGKGQERNWLLPLSVHVGIHALGTLIVCLACAPAVYWFAAVEFVVHFILDRAKGVLTRRLSATPSQSQFWWLLGIDQSLHTLTNFIFALWIAAAHV